VCVCVCVVGSVFRSSLLLFPWRPMETNQRPWLRTVLKPADREGRACLTHEEIAHVCIRIHTYQISICNSVLFYVVSPRAPRIPASSCCGLLLMRVWRHGLRTQLHLNERESTRSRHTSTRRAAAMAHRLSMMWVNHYIRMCFTTVHLCWRAESCVLCWCLVMGLQMCVCIYDDGTVVMMAKPAVVVMKW